MSIQHTVFFKFPSIAGEVPVALAEVVARFNALPGIAAQFAPHGVGIEGATSKEGFLENVSWPDKTEGYTHCLLVVAGDQAALKGYLHSDEHLKEWMPAVKPYFEGIIVFDNALEPTLVGAAQALARGAAAATGSGLCAAEALGAAPGASAAAPGGGAAVDYASLSDAEIVALVRGGKLKDHLLEV